MHLFVLASTPYDKLYKSFPLKFLINSGALEFLLILKTPIYKNKNKIEKKQQQVKNQLFVNEKSVVCVRQTYASFICAETEQILICRMPCQCQHFSLNFRYQRLYFHIVTLQCGQIQNANSLIVASNCDSIIVIVIFHR